MKSISRRQALIQSAGAFSLLFAPKLPAALALEESAPHFHINLYFYGSLDTSYMFDARPLSHTAASKIQNYNATDPNVWMGQNNQRALTPGYIDLLAPFKNEISILNGVHMAVDSESHDENLRFLLSGAASGNSLYFANLNRNQNRLPIDALNFDIGSFLTEGITDQDSFLSFSVEGAQYLQQMLKESESDSGNDSFQMLIDQRMADLAKKTGMLSKGAERIIKSIPGKNLIKKRVLNTDFSNQDEDRFINNLKMISQYFIHGISKSAFLSEINFTTDTHDSMSAKSQPETYSEITKKIRQLLTFLKNTPFDESRGISLFDVTTVSIGTEFNRTNRQLGYPISETGTDHNTLSNTLIFAGKGIRGGQVFGETDLDQINENGDYINISEVHLGFDRELNKRMGKPFDFKTARPVDELPVVYNPEHYLTIGSVLNTVYTLFGVPQDKFVSRNGKNSPILRQLLS